MLSIGSHGNTGDVTMRDIAGRDVINYYTPPPPIVDPVEEYRKRIEAKHKAEMLFSSATQAHIMGKYWDAKRMFLMVREIDPHYPQIEERLMLIDMQIERFDRPIPPAMSAPPTALDEHPAAHRASRWPVLLVVALLLLLLLLCLGLYFGLRYMGVL
jgi:hypothetical protein